MQILRDALGWQYISGTLPDGREFDRINNPQFEGYKFDPNGEYVQRWLPELARLPTEWVHEIDAAKARLQEALLEMWQHEAATRAVIENGTEEGLGDSSETAPIAFPQDIQMEVDHETIRNNPTTTTIRRYEDQMVPSMTASLVRVEEEETSSDLRNFAGGRAVVPTDANMNQAPRREAFNLAVTQTVRNNTLPRFNITLGPRNTEDSTADSSNSSRRDGGVVPVWSPSASNYSEQFVGEDNSYLQRHPQSHQIMNWRRLSQTG